jgi:hypothetical protein
MIRPRPAPQPDRTNAGAARSRPAPEVVRAWPDAVTAAGIDVVTAATAADQRTALGLGSAAVQSDAAFAAAIHTHAQADVTGLVAALGNKADFSHDHDAADITTGLIPATQISVDKGNFAASLAGFTGSTLQEVLDYIDANLT